MTTKNTFSARVEASQRELSEATAGLAAAENALEGARDAVRQIREKTRAGDESITAEALATGRAQVTICEDRLTYATDRLKRAQRNVLNDDTSIVTVIAAALADYSPLKGINIVATAETPSIPKTVQRSTLYLVQTAAAKHDAVSGRSSGLVEAYLHRPTWGRGLDVEDLPEFLARTEVYADLHSLGSREAGEVLEDHARLAVHGVWQNVPVIGKPNGAEIFGQTIAGRVATHLSRGRRGEVRLAREGYLGSTTALASAVQAQGEGRIVSTQENGGERRTTVEVTMALRSSNVDNGILGQEATAYLKDRVGRCETGLGRVAGVELVPVADSTDPRAGMRLGARFVFLSRPQ